MGEFLVTIKAVGGHGVDRDKKDGEIVDFNAEGEGSPDAVAKKCVDDLLLLGCVEVSATITHWPGMPEEVKDDLVTGIRSGNF